MAEKSVFPMILISRENFQNDVVDEKREVCQILSIFDTFTNNSTSILLVNTAVTFFEY